jgi:hypothetical protein
LAKKAKQISFKEWVKGLPADERLTHARETLERINNIAHFLNALHETNQIVVNTDTLRKQVDVSYAANAYNNFHRALQEIEVVRLCSLWDRGEKDAFSIPTVIDLIDNDDVIAFMSRFAGETRRSIGEREERQERRRICVLTRRAIQETREILGSETLKHVVNFRNKHIAHATALTRREREEGNVPLPSPNIGDETVLLDRTLNILERLDLCVRGRSFNWKESQKIAKRNAEYLWHGVTIKVLG